MQRAWGARASAWWAAAAATSGMMALVRPALVSAGPVIVLGAIQRHPARKLRMVAWLLLAWGIPLAAWAARNEVRYGFPGLSSVDGVNLYSHFSAHPEWMSDPRVRDLGSAYRGSRVAGLAIARDLIASTGIPFTEASALLRRQALQAIGNHPMAYAKSVLDAVRESCMPPETLLQGTGSGIRSRWPVLWPAVIGAFGVIAAAGLPVLLMNIPGSARLAIWIALAGFASNALLANIENVRYAFPLHALAVLAAAAVCDRVLHLLGRRLRSRKERGSPAGA